MNKDKTLADKIIFIDNLLDSTFSKKTYLYYRDIIEKLNSLQHDKDYLLEENIILNDIIKEVRERLYYEETNVESLQSDILEILSKENKE